MDSTEQTSALKGTDLEFVLKVLSKMKTRPEIDWKNVAAELGISRADNAQTRWRKIARQLGWAAYVDGDGTPTVTPKAVKTVTKRTPAKTSAKKTLDAAGMSSPASAASANGSPSKTAGIKKERKPRKKAVAAHTMAAMEAEIAKLADEDEVESDAKVKTQVEENEDIEVDDQVSAFEEACYGRSDEIEEADKC